MPKTVTRLPIYGVKDGDQVLDEYGNIYEFNSEQKSWIYKGVTQSYNVVSDTANGLVDPQLFSKLNLIEILKNDGYKFGSFKIDAGDLNPYFYYLHSTDDLIRFYPEASNKIRIEIDRSRLTQFLTKECCIGPKGKTGVDGQAGTDGIKAPNEQFISPLSTKDNVFDFETNVPTPIDTQISLRIFDSLKELRIEFLINKISTGTGDNDVTIIKHDESIEIEETSLSLTYENEILAGAIKFLSEDIVGWTYKARQVGPDGDAGADGIGFFEIIDQYYDDPIIRSTEAIVSLRKPNTNDDIFFIRKSLFDKVCTSNLVQSPTLPRGDIKSASFTSVKVTSKQCKDIGRYVFRPDDFDAPKLDLPAWTPTEDCCGGSQSNVRGFDWYNRVEPKYMFSVLEDPIIESCHCVDDFFWCPNVGDNPCGVEGDILPPAQDDTTSSSSSSSSTTSRTSPSSSSSSSDSSDSSNSSASSTTSMTSMTTSMTSDGGNTQIPLNLQINDKGGVNAVNNFKLDPKIGEDTSSASSASSVSSDSSVSSVSSASSASSVSSASSPSSDSSVSSTSSDSSQLSSESSPSSPSSQSSQSSLSSESSSSSSSSL